MSPSGRAALCLAALLLIVGCATRAANRPSASQGVVLVVDAAGPAPAVPDARRGGTITVLLNNGFEHLDPARAYVSRAQLTNQLLHRTLTAYRHGTDGRLELVGDLATDTGRATDGGRVWTFTLRDGLRFEDGTPVTASDVAYAIARSFSPALADGPTWLQQWLVDDPDFRQRYRGPYDGEAANPPGVSAPDAHTLVLRFSRPQPDVPFVVTLGNTAPVPRSRDTVGGYDDRPVSSGPYRIESYQPGTRLVLVRNPYWDPRTDPLRTAYPDRFISTFGQSPASATQRIVARKDGDRNAISLEQVPPELLLTVAQDRAIARHATIGTTPYVGYLKINTRRVGDLAVRRALNCAIDRDGYIKAAGGRAVAEPATTLLPRIVAGFHSYNAYDCGPSGDPQKAKRMLSGRAVHLRYGYRDSGRGPQIAQFLKASLARAGFDLELVPVDPNQYYSTIGTRDNGLDLYLATWGADWPTGASVLPALADGRTIAARGNSNTSYFDDAGIDAEIDRIRGMPDRDQAARAWGALDERIMRDHAPLVPVFYDRTCTANGPGVGGLHLDDILGVASLTNAFVA